MNATIASIIHENDVQYHHTWFTMLNMRCFALIQFWAQNQRQLLSLVWNFVENDGALYKSKRAKRFFASRVDVFENWRLCTAYNWQRLFGAFSPTQVHKLAESLCIHYSDVKVKCVSPSNMFLLFLYRMRRKAITFDDCGLIWGISKTSAEDIFKCVIKKFIDKYWASLVKWPSRQQIAISRRQLHLVCC